MRQRIAAPLARTPTMTVKAVVGGYAALRKRFFKIVAFGFAFVILALFFVLHLYFSQSKLNSLAHDALADVFDLRKVAVKFDEDRTRYTFPELDGTGQIELFNISVRSVTGEYDFLHFPHVVIHYDLFGLPSSPVARVEAPDGLYGVFNRDASGVWLDQDAFKAPEEKEEAARIPEIVVRGAFLRYRDPSIFTELPAPLHEALPAWVPRFVWRGEQGQFISGLDISSLRNPTDPEELVLRGQCNCHLWGRAAIVGSLRDDGALSMQLAKLGHPLSSAFIGRFATPVTELFDSFLAEVEGEANTVDIRARVDLGHETVKVSASLDVSGNVLYKAVPILCTGVRANISFDGRDIVIRDSAARRGAARITINGVVSDVGTNNEAVKVQVAARGLSIDQELRDALTGVDVDGALLYPEWELYKRAEAGVRPVVPPLFANLFGQFEPSGLADVDVTVQSRFVEADGVRRPVEAVDFKVKLLDVTAAWLGNDSGIAGSLAEGSAESTLDGMNSLRSLQRLMEDFPAPLPANPEPVRGIPLPLYNISGVIQSEPDDLGRAIYRIRGLNTEEAESVPRASNLNKLSPSPDGLVAHRAGGLGRVFVDGQIRDSSKREQDDSEVRLRISTQGLELNDELIRLLPVEIRDSLNGIGARGAVDIKDSELIFTPGQGTTAFQFWAERLRAAYRLGDAIKPFRLRDVQGAIRLDASGNLHVQEISGKLRDSDFLVSLTIDKERPYDRANYSVNVSGLPLNGELFDFLPTNASFLRRMFVMEGDQLKLSGNVDIELRGADNGSGEPPRLEMVLRIHDGTAAFEALSPLEFDRINGTIRLWFGPDGVHGVVESLSARPLGDSDTSALTIDGTVSMPANTDDAHYNLTLDARDIRLSESLRVTIDRLLGGTAERPSAVGGIWRDLQPEAGATLGLAGICVSVAGTIDNPDPVERLQAGIELKDCALTYSGFALPLRGVSGRIGISRAGESSSIVLSGFRASAPAGTVELANLMFDAGDANGGGRFSITISGRGIPLDDNLRNAFPEELRGMYDALDPNARLKSWVDRPERAGSVNLDVTLTLEGARMEYDAKIEFVDADLELGVTFNDCSGLLACRGAMWDDAEGHRLANHIIYDGRVQFDLARWKGLTFTGVTAAVQYDNGRFILPNIRGEIHEGILEGSLMLDYSATEPKYEGNFTARRVSLGSIAQVLDGAYDPNAKDAMRGGLDAEINFHPLDKSGEIGKGRIDIGRIPLSVEELKRIHDLPKEEFDALAPEQRYGKPGALGRVPLFEGLYKALDVEEAGLFDEAHIIFRLMEDRMKIRQMELLSDVLSIAASGGINVDNDDRNPYAKNPSIFAADIESDTNYILYQPDDKGNELDFTLVPNFAPRLPSMPVAQTVFDAFKGVVAKIFVSGTFIKPEVGVGSRLRERTKDDWHDVDPDRSSNRPG